MTSRCWKFCWCAASPEVGVTRGSKPSRGFTLSFSKEQNSVTFRLLHPCYPLCMCVWTVRTDLKRISAPTGKQTFAQVSPWPVGVFLCVANVVSWTNYSCFAFEYQGSDSGYEILSPVGFLSLFQTAGEIRVKCQLYSVFSN